MKKITFTILLSFIGISATINAQRVEVSTGADLVSSYIWRGVNMGPAAFQPGLSASYKGFTWGAWGSVALESPATDEFDLYLSYANNGFTVTLTDYSFPTSITPDYFTYDKDGLGHQLELGAACTISKKLPLSLAWNTFIAGADKKPADIKKQNFSSYFEAGYSLSAGSVTLDFAVGGTPWESSVYATDGFGITKLSVKGSKEIKITDAYSLPVFSQAILNPNAKAAFLVFGLSF